MKLKPSDLAVGLVIAVVLIAGTLGVTDFSTVSYAMNYTGDPEMDASPRLVARKLIPVAPQVEYSLNHSAAIEVAEVFKHSQTCEEADPEFIELVAQEAVRAGIEPRMLAATLVVESGCRQYVISKRGAVGYMQVMPRVWKNRYDIAGEYNLFNDRDNVRVGAAILSQLVQTYGIREGVRRYQGTGEDCSTCDRGYTAKIIALAKHD